MNYASRGGGLRMFGQETVTKDALPIVSPGRWGKRALVSYNGCMPKLSIKDLDLKDKTVFIRVDFNVPLAPGGKEITRDKRIRGSLPTIQDSLDQGAGLILA